MRQHLPVARRVGGEPIGQLSAHGGPATDHARERHPQNAQPLGMLGLDPGSRASAEEPLQAIVAKGREYDAKYSVATRSAMLTRNRCLCSAITRPGRTWPR